MRIAVLHLGFFYAGGGERLVLEEVRGLRRMGHQVECFAPIVDAESCHPDLIEEVGVTALIPAPPRWLPARVALWVLLCCLLAPVLALRLKRFQVILAANQPALWLAWVAAGILRRPYVAYLAQPLRVLHPRPIDLAVGQPNPDYRLAAAVARCARPLVAWADRRSVAGATCLLANGRYVSTEIERIYGLPVLDCPAGGTARPEAELDAGQRQGGELTIKGRRIAKPYVLLTNRHFPQKRFEHAVRALSAVPGMRLVVTGAATPYTARIAELAVGLGVRSRLHLTGLVSQRCLQDLYTQAAVYVYPAPEEDYGMGIVEAMAHGLPVVAWRSAGPVGIVEHEATGLLVAPGDQDEFNAAIARLLERPGLSERLGQAGRRLVADRLSEAGHLSLLERELQAALKEQTGLRRRGWSWLRLPVQAAAGLILLAVWAHLAPLAQVAARARPHAWPPLAGGLLLLAGAAIVRSWRWALISRPLARLSVPEAFSMNAAGGLLNYLAPIRTGDAARVWWLRRRHGTSTGGGLASVLADKAYDLLSVALVLCLAAALTLLSRPALNPWTDGANPVTVAALAALSLIALLAGAATLAAGGPRLLGRGRLGRQALAFRSTLLGASRSWPLRLGLSLLALGIDTCSFALLFVALGVALPLPAVAAAYAALALSYAVPAAPAYVGSTELAGTLVIGGWLGLPAVAAAGATLLWHGVNALSVVAMGLLGLARLRTPRLDPSQPPARIAVLHCGFIYSGGGERIVIEEVLGLRRLGYQVDCFAPTVDPRACYPDLLPEVAPSTFLPQLPSWVPLRDALHMLAASMLVPLYAWRFRHYDAILGANQPGAWIAWCLSHLLDVPYVVYLNQPNRLVHPRDIDRQTGWQNRPDYHLLNAVIQRFRFLVRAADQRSVRGAARLLVNGGYIGDVIRHTYRRGVVDCPAGVHLRAGRPLPAELRFSGAGELNGQVLRRPYVLLTNRHEPQKRFDLAIRALALVRRTHPAVQLAVPGPHTAHTPELRRLARELGLEDAVLFCGSVSEVRLQRLYDEAAVYVYPAPEEDFGMGVVEAMASGIPVVAWDRAGPTVTVEPGRTGHLAGPGDLEDFAAAVAGYLSDEIANQETGRRAQQRAGWFSWLRHVATVEQALLDACGFPDLDETPDATAESESEAQAQTAGMLAGE
ncbi:glycosyltransferase [Candidatus Nephthysia bennettiae]|uniref:Glycosyltransferase n=1 Tax=Candidatus Nephthysia bennettiae TaxID=3127016 RepID=A0A934K703_9BACT|nr:glycosyltransferase [Candidatus Dormibacteraeota bacterium]MBJ7614357.1 glycosyltransferase [Candidatus Dormibacteraeota bacterium]